MSKKQTPRPGDLLNSIPNWLKASMLLITGIITFVVSFRQHLQLGTVVISGLLWGAAVYYCVYIITAVEPPEAEGEPPTYRHARYRPWAMIGLAAAFLLLISILGARP